MADGNTPQGAWPVTLEFTADEVEMLIRSIDTAVMSSGSGLDSSGNPKDNMQIVAYREFLKEIIGKLRKALNNQRP